MILTALSQPTMAEINLQRFELMAGIAPVRHVPVCERSLGAEVMLFDGTVRKRALSSRH